MASTIRKYAASDKDDVSGGEVTSRYRRLWLYSVLSMAFVALAPLVIMTYVNYHQYRDSLTAEMIHPISLLVSNSRRFIDDFLEERRAALTYVVNRESYEDLCDAKKLNRIFRHAREAFGGFVDMGVIDSAGNQRSYVGPYQLEGKNYRGEDWFDHVERKGVYVSDVFLGYRKVPHFVIAVRKDDLENDDHYILRATIDTDVLNEYIASLDLGASSDVFLINHDGFLQTRSLQEGNVLDQCPIETPRLSFRTEVEPVTTRDGQSRILGYAYVDRSPFIFVVLEHPEAVTRNWLGLRSDILWLLCTSVFFVLAVVLWSSRNLVNRIREADDKKSKALHNIEYTNKMASIGRMAAGVAHEINNPLAIINENAGLLKDLVSRKKEPLDPQRCSRIADSIVKSVDRCSAITHRLLGFAKRMEPQAERVALKPLLEEVLSFQGKEADYRNIRIRLEAPDDLPNIESDRGQLQQVFLNILNNAIGAVDEGGRIEISLRQEDENTTAVTISDNGPGIPEDNIDKIFEPFFSTKEEYGTGLGLSITYGIVHKLGGSIEVQSAVGEGASFTVRLPISKRH
jgi:signal transduction histidine kinase